MTPVPYPRLHWSAPLRLGGPGGLAVPPPAVGHWLALERLGSPLLGGGPATAADAVAAALVLRADAAAPFAARGWRLRLETWRVSRAVLPGGGIAMIRLRALLAEAWAGPDTWRDPASRAGEAPPAPSLKVSLMARLHCSETEALRYPIRRALWDLTIWAEGEGRTELAGARSADQLAQAKAAAARWAAEQTEVPRA